MRKDFTLCKIAPSQITDVSLCFEAITGNIDWLPPTEEIPTKTLTKRPFSPSTISLLKDMSSIVREGGSEMALYPRVAYVLIESIRLYQNMVPSNVEVYLEPSRGTDKTTDYVIVVVTAVSF